MKIFGLALLFVSTFAYSQGQTEESIGEPPQYYRDLSLRVRKTASFRVFLPGGSDLKFNYQFPNFSKALWDLPRLADMPWNPEKEPKQFFRLFWDKIFVEENSSINIGEEKIPLTCAYISGQDNRYSGKDTPLLPDIIFKVYLVANDFSCTGPINPGYPGNGGRKETWDTYIYYEVRDPTIMQPTNAKIRYRWNEFEAVFIDGESI